MIGKWEREIKKSIGMTLKLSIFELNFRKLIGFNKIGEIKAQGPTFPDPYAGREGGLGEGRDFL